MLYLWVHFDKTIIQSYNKHIHSSINYKTAILLQYKQEDVSKENDFYHQLIAYALPTDLMQRQTSDKGTLLLIVSCLILR